MNQKSLIPTSGSEAFHAKMSPWLEWASEMGFEESDLDSFMSLLSSLSETAPEFWSSKTFQASCLPTEDETSESLFERWPNSGMASDGVCLTAKTSESPNHGSESSLWDAIEKTEVPETYFLSPNAAKGMMRRADRMGRKLFPHLRESLEILAARDQSSQD